MSESIKQQIRNQLARLPQMQDQGNNIFICCPFHKDRSPSFSIYTGRASSNGTPVGWGYCWGCGMSVPWQEAAKALNLDATLNGSISAEPFSEHLRDLMLPRKRTIKSLMEDCKCEGELPIETNVWRGIPKTLLKDMGCFYTDYVNLDYGTKRRCLFIPCYVDGMLVGAIRANLKKRDGKNTYFNSPGPWSLTKGYFGLDYSHKKFKPEMPIIVMEGPRDSMCWIRDGYPASSILGSKSFSKEKARYLAATGRKLILFFDGDKAGIKANNLVLNTLREVMGKNFEGRVFSYKLIRRMMKVLDIEKEEAMELKYDPAFLCDDMKSDFIKYYKRIQAK